ncbi:MAG: dodecin family protein [Syntrophobacteraceae bacterium]
MSVYKIVELVGTSPNSREEAAKEVIETSTKSLRDLRIAEVDRLDMRIENGKVVEYRVRVKLSFKYEGSN